MFHDGESVKEDVVLGTDAETMSNLVHVTPDVVPIDDCCTRCWGVQTCNSQVFGQTTKKRPTGHTIIWPEKEIYGRHTFVLFVS